MMNKIMLAILFAVSVTSPAVSPCDPGDGQQRADERERHNRPPDADRDRWYWQMPNRVMNEIGIREGLAVADIGAGQGYFATRLAARVGRAGKVYANDIDESALAVLRERCRQDGIVNVEIVRGTADDPRLPPAAVDLALIVNVLHLLKDPAGFLAKVRASLRSGGTLVVIHWDAEKMDAEMPVWDPGNRSLFTLDTVLRRIYSGGFETTRIQTFLPMQNIYHCRPAK